MPFRKFARTFSNVAHWGMHRTKRRGIMCAEEGPREER
jgi:hypothetical protein